MLTVLTWLPFMAFVAMVERPWDTSLGYDAVQERIHQPQPIPPEYVTADFRDGRRFLPELRRVATGSHSAVAAEAPPQTESAPGEQHVLTTSTDINCDDDHSLVRVRVRHPWAAKR